MVLTVVALITVAAVANLVSGPMARGRVERFARRQRLTVTVDNGEQVIRYLATTRRWRGAGLAAGLILSVAVSLPDQLRVDFVTLFAGWFVGTLVAEARVTHVGFGRRYRRPPIQGPSARRSGL